MTSEELAFFAAIRQDPENDLPRLVFADWLEENGQSEYAEFIRLQIQIWRGKTRPRRKFHQLCQREKQLRQNFASLWETRLPAGFARLRYHRGFITDASCRCDAFHKTNKAAIVDPIDSLTIQIDELQFDWLQTRSELLDLPIRNLHIHTAFPVGQVLTEVLARYGPYKHLKKLVISDSGLDAEALLNVTLETFPNLRTLKLQECETTPEMIQILVDLGWNWRLNCFYGFATTPRWGETYQMINRFFGSRFGLPDEFRIDQ